MTNFVVCFHFMVVFMGSTAFFNIIHFIEMFAMFSLFSLFHANSLTNVIYLVAVYFVGQQLTLM